MAASPPPSECRACRHQLSPVARFCEACGFRVNPSESAAGASGAALSPSALDASAFSVRLWDKLPQVAERCRDSKHTCRTVAAVLHARSQLEANYARDLRKITASVAIPESAASSLGSAWNSMIKSWDRVADLHMARSRSLISQGSDPLESLRQRLRTRRADLCEQVDLQFAARNEAGRSLGQARARLQAATERVQVIHQRLAAGVDPQKNSEKLRVADAEMAAAQVQLDGAQTVFFFQTNRHIDVLTKALDAFGALEVDRIRHVALVLQTVQGNELDALHASMLHVAAARAPLAAVDGVADTLAFVLATTSNAPCPWSGSATQDAKASLAATVAKEKEALAAQFAIPALPVASPAGSDEMRPTESPSSFFAMSASALAPPRRKSSAATAAPRHTGVDADRVTATVSNARIAGAQHLRLTLDDDSIEFPRVGASRGAARGHNASVTAASTSAAAHGEEHTKSELSALFLLECYARMHASSSFAVSSDNADLMPEFRFPHIFPPQLVALIQSVEPQPHPHPHRASSGGARVADPTRLAWLMQATEHQYCAWQMTVGQCKLAALEMFCLCSNMLQDFPDGNRPVLEDALRIAVLLPKAEFRIMCDRLRLEQSPLHGISQAETQLHLNYRFDLLRQQYNIALAQGGLLADEAVEYEMKWFQRHLAVLFAAVMWHVNSLNRDICLSRESNSTSSAAIDLSPHDMMLYVTRTVTKIIQLLHAGMEQRALPPFDVVFGVFESILVDVAVAVRGSRAAQLPYPTPLAANAFLTLLSFLVYKPEPLDEHDDEIEPASLQQNWKQLLAALLRFPRAYRVGPETQLFGLLPVFFEVLNEQLSSKGLHLLEVLETRRDALAVEIFEAIESTFMKIAQEIASDRASGFDLAVARRILGTSTAMLECVLADYHSHDAAAAGRVMNVLASCLRSLRTVELCQESLEASSALPAAKASTAGAASKDCLDDAVSARIGLTLYRSSLRQYQRIRANFFKQGLNVAEFEKFSEEISDGLSTDVEFFLPELVRLDVHCCPGEVSLLNMLSLYSRDCLALFHPKSSAQVSPESFLLHVIPAMQKTFTHCDALATLVCRSGPARDGGGVGAAAAVQAANQEELGRELMHHVLPSLPALCVSRLRDWIDINTFKSKQWLPRCLEMDSWTFVDDSKHSTSVVDVFSFLSTLASCFESFVEKASPAIMSVASGDLFVSFVTDIVVGYATAVLASVRHDQHLIPPAGNLKAVRLDESSSGLLDAFRRTEFFASSSSSSPGFFDSLFSSKSLPAAASKSSAASLASAASRPAASRDMDAAASHCPLLCHPLDQLLVKLADLHAVAEHLSSYASSLEAAWEHHRRKFNGQASVMILQSDESDSKVDCGTNLRVHTSLALPSVPIPEFKRVFAGACSRLRDFAVQLRVKVAQRVVWGEWRDIVVHELYMPFQFRAEVAVAALRKALPAAGHLVGFASAHVQLRLEATLAHLCSKLGAACYEPTVKIIFSELVRSIEWALLHGFSLRSFSQADASAVAKDVDALRDYFAAEFDVALIKERSASLEEILALMEMATDSLIETSRLLGMGPAAAQQQTRIRHVLWNRGPKEKPARKFIKRLNEIEKF